jgi:hypothetical protein
VGVLGNFLVIAILFLEVHKAQVKPANRNMINLVGKGTMPNSQVLVKSLKEVGYAFKWNTSLIKLQINLAM